MVYLACRKVHHDYSLKIKAGQFGSLLKSKRVGRSTDFPGPSLRQLTPARSSADSQLTPAQERGSGVLAIILRGRSDIPQVCGGTNIISKSASFKTIMLNNTG